MKRGGGGAVHVDNRDRRSRGCSLSRKKAQPIRNRKKKKCFGCGVSFVISVSCGVVLLDSEARGTAPSEVMPHWFCFWIRGKQGVGVGLY